MRRKDREIQDSGEIEALIERAAVCRLGLCYENVPYVVPLSFGYREGCLYFHSAKEGRKIDMIRRNRRVCFEIDTGVEVIPSEKPCDWGMEYASVIGFGEASLLEDPEEKTKGLDVILGHYSSRPSHEYPASVLEHTAVIKVQVQEMTGKRSGQ
jgi:hypothetical protein